MAGSTIAEMFEREYAGFKRYLRARFNRLSEYDAEDIIQETVLKILYKGDDALGIKNLSSYMYTALRNGAIDHMKKKKREVLGEITYEETEQSAEDEALLNEMKKVLKKAIDSLDEKYRYIFVETEIKGRSYSDISNETGQKLGTLLSQKSRAVKKLKTIMQKYLNGRQSND